MTNFFRWLLDRTLGTYAALFILALFIGTTYAVSWDVTNEPQMYLDVSISNTQTTGIILAAPQRNGVDKIFNTTTGGVLRFRSGSRVEDIAYTSATVNSTTYKVTLVGVTRNICPGRTEDLTSCGNGQYFPKGAIVELSVDARLLNLKADTDRVNLFTASGGIRCTSTSQPCIYPGSFTTAQRDAFTFGNSFFSVIYNSTLGVAQYRVPSSQWVSFGSGTTTNATNSVGGKVQLSTLTDQQNRAGYDASTGEPLVVWVGNVLSTSTGTTSAGAVPALNSGGYLSVRVGGTGTGGFLTGSLLVGQGLGRIEEIRPTSHSGMSLVSDGRKWAAVSAPVRVIQSSTASTTATGASSLLQITVQSFTIPANDCTAGTTYDIYAKGDLNGGVGGAEHAYRIKVAGQTGAYIEFGGALGSEEYLLQATITCRTTGASGTVYADMGITRRTLDPFNASGTYLSVGSAALTVDTTSAMNVQFTFQPRASSASASIDTDQWRVIRYAGP